MALPRIHHAQQQEHAAQQGQGGAHRLRQRDVDGVFGGMQLRNAVVGADLQRREPARALPGSHPLQRMAGHLDVQQVVAVAQQRGRQRHQLRMLAVVGDGLAHAAGHVQQLAVEVHLRVGAHPLDHQAQQRAAVAQAGRIEGGAVPHRPQVAGAGLGPVVGQGHRPAGHADRKHQ
ncbi:hypothetical protein [Aquincola sp. J276]|uniref:hypothetical protein n=1 Tax=Aquincola sp. J276 TaxID=2898432 RepID=UPI0028735A9B|nr:hypothetical protein [Aquincola sp. J276]